MLHIGNFCISFHVFRSHISLIIPVRDSKTHTLPLRRVEQIRMEIHSQRREIIKLLEEWVVSALVQQGEGPFGETALQLVPHPREGRDDVTVPPDH